MREFETYYLYDTTQGSDDWHHMRKGRITMSNLGKVVGHCPFVKHEPEHLAKLLKGEIKEKFTPEAIERMRKGNEYEPIVRKVLEKKFNKKIDETGFAVWKADTRFGASLDGIIDDDTGIEIKCPAKVYWPLKKNKDMKDIGCIWDSHYDQIIGNGVITGRKNMIYAVYGIEDKQLYIQNVKVDYDYWFNFLYPKACEFYDKYMLDSNEVGGDN
jgi:putative phage-type endonuclease